jgi:carboxypeptidase Q
MPRTCSGVKASMGLVWSIALLMCGLSTARAQHSDDSLAVRRIRLEAMDHSAVIENAFYLADVFGPRFLGSPAMRQASDWAMQRLRSYGVAKVWREPVPPPIEVGPGLLWSGTGWSVDRFAIQQLTPHHAVLIGHPVMLSASTSGREQGDAFVLLLPDAFAAVNNPNDSTWSEFFVRNRGRLRGKILLIGPAVEPAASIVAPLDLERPEAFHRYTSQDLAAIAQRPASTSVPHLLGPPPGFSLDRFLAAQDRLFGFLRAEGVVALLRPAQGANGTIVVGGPLVAGDPRVTPPATIELAAEHYNRLVRLAEHGVPARIEVELVTRAHPGEGVFNTLGELPGSSKAHEVIMIGAHLDSQHIGTGATDNAVSCAILMEAVRILRTLDLRLERTVRIALWGGEEAGYLGSRSYVQTHFGKPTGEAASEYANFSGYLNLDAGAGQIRGIYVNGIDSLIPIFRQWLAPFTDWEATTVSLRDRRGSDYDQFVDVGLPGLPFIQDPLDYFAVTHHSNMDVLDHVLPYEQDIKRSAAIVAWIIYKAANAPSRLPRRPRAGSPGN